MAIESSTLHAAAPATARDLLPWAGLAAALALVVVPTYVRLHQTLWKQEAYEHGFIIAVLFWFLVWREREALRPNANPAVPWLGLPVFIAGLFTYFVGRSQNLPLFEVTALLPIFAGLLLTTHGLATVRRLWFALLFLVFMIPLPGFVTLGITGELKQQVSWMAEALLYRAGYPIARDGVVITVGQYRMLVADACAGLNSIYSLTAMGLLYMYLMRRPSWLHNLILLASILPIAIAANLLRVVVLILLTFHFGDAAGQGFMHGASGIFLFVVALLLLIALDLLLVRFVFRRRSSTAPVPMQVPR